MARRYLVDPLPEPGMIRLPEEISHHLGRVLRADAGETITLFDGRGGLCEARLVSRRGGRLQAEIGPVRRADPEPGPQLHLAVAMPKGPRADWLIEQATALGVHAIHPIVASRSANRRGRVSRWQRLAAAAAGQCDRDLLPLIGEPRPLAALLEDPALPAERYLAHGAAPVPLERATGTTAVLLVGPEGGFSDSERAAAEDHGFRPFSLGPLVLRVETAALAGIVLLGRPHELRAPGDSSHQRS